jgi:hypothetical protein
VLAIWTPLKDLETFDAFMRGLETVTNDALVAEVRLRPLLDPMKMNGSAMVMVGAPASVEPAVCRGRRLDRPTPGPGRRRGAGLADVSRVNQAA